MADDFIFFVKEIDGDVAEGVAEFFAVVEDGSGLGGVEGLEVSEGIVEVFDFMS